MARYSGVMGYSRGSITLAAIAAAALALLSGCQQLSDLLGITDPWAGYYDSTENFIAAHGLDQEDLTTAGYQRNAVWTWAWRGQNDASDITGFSYMSLSLNATASPPPSLPATPVYDLELLNLYPGGGDFEGSSAPPSKWTANGTGVTFTAQTASALVIHGSESMQIDAGSNSYAGFELNSLLDQVAVTTASHSYNWRFFAMGSSYACQSFTSGFDANKSAPVYLSTTPQDYSLPIDLLVPAGTTTTLAIGYNSPIQNFIFDDVRVLRSDIKDYCNLRLLLQPADTGNRLRSGFYEFALWVRKAPSRSFVSEPGAMAPYAASRVTLSMHSLVPDVTGNEHAFPIDGSVDSDGSVYDAASGWVRLVLRAKNFTIDSSSTAEVMEIAIFPFDDLGYPDTGSVEIADPELHFYLNGY